MGIKLGNSSISSFKLGSNSVSKIYLGSSSIWPSQNAPCNGTESSLLLHFDENTTINDSSSNNINISVLGDATISSAQSRFGNSSLLLQNGGFIRIDEHPSLNFDYEDFTIELWFYPITISPFCIILSSRGFPDGALFDAKYLFITTGSVSSRYINFYSNNSYHAQLLGPTIATDQWYHLAVTRQGTALRTFCNGIKISESTVVDVFNTRGAGVCIGGSANPTFITTAYIDEVRIVKGAALYIDNFTPPNNALDKCVIGQPLPYATHLFSICENGNLVAYYANGTGGTYIEIMSDGSCTGWDGYDYYIDGVKTSLPQSGTGIWNNLYYVGGSLYTGYLDTTDKYYLNGVETTLNSDGDGCWDYDNYDNGSIVPPQNAGYDSCSEVYWLDIGGVITPTDLNSDGNGYWSLTDKYYIGGVETTLDSSGNGFWNDQAYYNGNAQSTGWNNYHYYIDHAETNLDSNGSGFWNDQAYYNGNPQESGWNGYYYYMNHQQTSLDNYGNGDWNDLHYDGGNLATGYHGATYYINGVATTLSEGGNGYWATTNKYYLGGTETMLDPNGDGCYNNNNYASGSIVPVTTEGWDVCTNKYYLTNMYGALSETPLSSNGDGWWQDMNLYYLGGIPAYGLDSNGDGCSNGYIYYSGVISEETC